MMAAHKENITASLDGLEIGASGPGQVRLVLESANASVAIGLTATEARWLAKALQQWADQSETILSTNLN